MIFCKSCRKLNTLITSVDSLPKPTLKPLKSKWKYKLDENVERNLETIVFKPRHHPGIAKPKTVHAHPQFTKAVMNILEDQDYPKANLLDKSLQFVKHLTNKKPPMEQDELKNTINGLRKNVIDRLSETRSDLLNNHHVIKNQIYDNMKKAVYNWVPVKYDNHNSLLYLVGRSAADYAVLVKIFSEIKARDSDLKPRTLFDFGSGVGTVTWAANTLWPKSFQEYFNVDSSPEINELAELLLKGGKGEKQISLRGVYYRQFLPATPTPYDLVVSAYTLMELPSLQSRLEVIRNLWKKTTKYLVVVEQGSNAGYKIINEVRDFVLSLGNGHVFSPCPHDDLCPRYMLNDGTPCNFEIRYYSLPVSGSSSLLTERYSYIVLKKGPRNENDPQWPRLVRPTLLRHKHCVCNLCTTEGKIEQAVFSASKYGKFAYRCAKSSDWGDLLPMNVKENSENSEATESTDDNLTDKD